MLGEQPFNQTRFEASFLNGGDMVEVDVFGVLDLGPACVGRAVTDSNTQELWSDTIRAMPKTEGPSSKEWTPTAVLVKARATPEIVTVPERMALAIDGRGAPTGETFQQGLAALYGVAYALKFSRKKSGRGAPFKVAALEGRWAAEGCFDESTIPPAECWTWRLRIAVPPDMTEEEVAAAVREATTKKGGKLEGSSVAGRVFLEGIPEGKCGRILHIGPYADEPHSFAVLAPVIAAAGLRPVRPHIEVYLSDPRRTSPEKLKTVLLKELM